MLTLNTRLRIPDTVIFTSVEQDAILLNTSTNQYFALEEVGMRFWELISAGQTLRDAHQALLAEYDVSPDALERDLLDLLDQLKENGLVEVVDG